MRLAMLGLGAMGQRMTARAVEAGLEVVTWNRSPRTVTGAASAATPAEAAAGADVVLTMLTDVDASREVWMAPETGALEGLGEGAVAVEASTVTATWTEELGQAVHRVGGRFLEAPVVGTRPHADRAALTVLVGGDDADLARARPALESWGHVVPVGAVGSAMTLKLAVNAMFAGQVALLGECLALLGTAGIETDQALQLLEPTPVFAPVLHGIAALLRADDEAPRFPVALVEKDLRYAADPIDGVLLRAVAERYSAAVELGLGDRNLHAVARVTRPATASHAAARPSRPSR